MVTRQFRSGLEETLAAQIEAANVTVKYEETSFAYTWPERPSRYTVDFELPGIAGKPIYIEAKGLFDVQARHKMILVRQQHPDADIRLVFSNSNAKLYKNSKTTYAQWAERHGFLWAHKVIPEDWLHPEQGENYVAERQDPGPPPEGGVDQLP